MKRFAELLPLFVALLSAAVAVATLVGAQEDPTLDAKRRVFPEVGAGFRGVRRGPDGSYYILRGAAPAPPKPSKGSRVPPPPMPAILVFDSRGAKLREIPIQARPREHVSPDSLDIDTTGRVYIADANANAVSIYAPDGTFFVRLNIPAPAQIVALPPDQFAVAGADAGHLIAVYDLQGKLLREFGELADLSDGAELNHRLNAGHLAKDKAGLLYFAFRYLPEPTVRKYDPESGSLVDELSLTTLDLAPMAQSARQEIARAGGGKPLRPHEIISGFGVDPETQEFWLALGNLLMHFDNADNRMTTSRAYTIDGARMVPNFILLEKDRLLLGSDPLGIYEFLRVSDGIHPAQ